MASQPLKTSTRQIRRIFENHASMGNLACLFWSVRICLKWKLWWVAVDQWVKLDCCFIKFKSGFFKKTLAPLWAASSVEILGCSPYTIGGEFIILPTAARHSSNFKQKRTLQNRHAKFPKLARFSKILLICLVLVLRGWLATSNISDVWQFSG